jgi:osmotically-inducible protein OsmY
MRRIAIAAACLLAAAGCAAQSDADAQRRPYATITPPRPAAEDRRAPNNTSVNTRDIDKSEPTPLDQGTSDADIGRTADIRKRIVDTELSITAKNVKVITRDGRVTLRGLVTTQAEKDTIERIAREVAGADNVDDRLDVETATGTSR